ncbi:MAG: histidine kinase [Methylococcaceae bacterium]|nr:histidine kinase [Methylococcaceae bacterium]
MGKGPAGRELIRLRLLLGGFFLALAIPTALLVERANDELKWESMHQHRLLAEELAGRIDRRLAQWIQTEQARSFADYGFLTATGNTAANFVQRSPLAGFPPSSAVPGLLGYFQVDAEGRFSSPVLPGSVEQAGRYGVAREELAQRRQLQNRLLDILSRNRLVQANLEEIRSPIPLRREADDREAAAKPPTVTGESRRQAEPESPAPPSQANQAAFDALSSGKLAAEVKVGLAEQPRSDAAAMKTSPMVADKKDRAEWQAPASVVAPAPGGAPARQLRKEKGVVPEAVERAKGEAGATASPVRITTFESELDDFEFSRLGSGHFVLFRKVWRDGKRYIQGLLVEPGPALEAWIGAEFADTALAHMSRLTVSVGGEPLATFRNEPSARSYSVDPGQLQGQPLYRTRLSAPLADVELAFTVADLPAGPGVAVVGLLAVVLAAVLTGGFTLMYRLGRRQIRLARQQQDFVAAVSHELKTPLTSIRMYGEMLKEGWVSEDKKPGYYDFIHSEAERLSRLIANVLQLARMSRNNLPLELKPVAVSELLDSIRSKVDTAVERAGFTLALSATPEAAAATVEADADAFTQMVINLVDNALKFSAQSTTRRIELGCSLRRNGWVVFSVRDYGPGVPKDQARKIFQLFYRMENELTRQTVGTGIGLALVQRLAQAMGGKVDLVNREPGAEFQLAFPAVEPGSLGAPKS